MAQALGVRATSFAASTALLGLAVIAAMSVSVTLQTFEFNGPPAVPIVRLDETPPTPTPIERNPLPQTPAEDETFTDAASAMTPEAAPEPSFLSFAPPAGPPEIT